MKMRRDRSLDRNQPRKIDIDILTYGNKKIKDSMLTIPHPGISDRKFVLMPLIDIDPNYIVPGFTINVKEMLEKIENNNDKVYII